MLKMQIDIVEWPLKEPFTISRDTLHAVRCVQVMLYDELGNSGQGEAVGVDYHGETPEFLVAQLEALRPEIERGMSHKRLQSILPAGGARNAVDCALWDLNAKHTGIPAWKAAGLETIEPRPTAITFGIMTEAKLRGAAASYAHFPLLKVKTDKLHGIDPVRIVHEVAPLSKLIVDPNQAWDEVDLVKYRSLLTEFNVALLEQPVAIDNDAILDSVKLPVPVAADEAFNDRNDIERLAQRYQVLNIKLDKTGGLTEALACARLAAQFELRLMVGCMIGSSLSMAPALLIAQMCDFVDLDGPLLQAADMAYPIKYEGGHIYPPQTDLWG